jgi:hypothetical protein
MELVSIFLLLAVVLLVAFFVSTPLLVQKRNVRRDDLAFSSLMAERDRVLSAIQELDFDHTLGKIPEDEYPIQREVLVKKGVGILRQLDEYEGVSKKTPRKPSPVPPIANDDEIEDLIASRRSGRKEKMGGFCPNCGNPMLLSDRFCPKCGQSVRK